MKYQNGYSFLNNLYKDMYAYDSVKKVSNSDKKEDRILQYINKIQKIHESIKNDKHKVQILKKLYYEKYIIKELPESFIKLYRKLNRENGLGSIIITAEKKLELLNLIRKSQIESLDKWIDFFVYNTDYPTWFKYYAFNGMVKINKFDKNVMSFTKRTKTTTAPFIDLNEGALYSIYKSIINNNYSASNASFKYLHEVYIKNDLENLKIKDGIWIKYEKNSDSNILCSSLKNKNTGWCIANNDMAYCETYTDI